MENEFIPYEQALALKELGFDEPCFATIDQTEFLHINGTKKLPRGSMMYDTIDCPTFSQAFRWFREKYNLWDMIYPRDGWNYSIQKMDETISCTGESWHKVEIKSYEEAELECLTKLIEICKK